MRCLFYALGGGRGHQSRARNIHRALRGLNGPRLQTTLLVPENRVPQLEPGLECLSPPCRDRQVLASWVESKLNGLRPNIFVVDTFPRGVLGELSDLKLKIPTILISRWVNPLYYLKQEVKHALSAFNKVLWCEPKSDLSFPGQLTEPIVDERPTLNYEQARKYLNGGERPLILALTAAAPESNWQKLQEVATLSRWDLRLVNSDRQNSLPRLDLVLSGVDLVISASGYNSYYEISKHGTPVIWIPQKRKVDDQKMRATGLFPWAHQGPQKICLQEPGEEDIAELLSLSAKSIEKRQRPQAVSAGAKQAAQEMLELLDSAL